MTTFLLSALTAKRGILCDPSPLPSYSDQFFSKLKCSSEHGDFHLETRIPLRQLEYLGYG
jgi:hypothetical protein